MAEAPDGVNPARIQPGGAAIRSADGGPVAGSPGPPFDVVALVTSAGGLSALNQVLLTLPDDFGAALVIVQHLGGSVSSLVEILGRRSPLPVQWIGDHDPLEPGRVSVCPPQQLLEVLPDGECSLRPMEPEHRLRPIDYFLASLADSYGRRAMVVVLTGMGRDSAVGCEAVSRAGGTVLVQSPESAEHPVMPSAVIGAGVADMVLPLPQLGRVIADLVAGGALPRTLGERSAADKLFAGDGEVAALLREVNWARTPFGPVGQWPAALRTVIRIVLDSPLAMCLLWGPDQVQVYNDAYRLVMGDKHPAGLGQPNRDCWPEVWHLNEPIFARVSQGEPVALRDALFPISRHGAMENAWFNLSYLPVRDDDGQVAGALCVVVETTAEVLGSRRLGTLHALTIATSESATRGAAFEQALDTMAANDQDIPFAIGYYLDAQKSRAQLAGAAGVQPGGPMAPYAIELTSSCPWPLPGVVTGAEPMLVDQLAARFPGVVMGPDGQQPSSALLLALPGRRDARPAGVLILGVNPLLPLNASYRDFLVLVAAQTEAALAEAQNRHRERHRLQRLAELDQAKTEFYANISHEFRTPLTLLLSPLDELARRRAEIPADLAAEMDVATRNARRLLNLVDTLLDFSRLEAGRLRARLRPTDLAALTAGIASVFRGAAQRAGLRLRVDCPPLPDPVWVDPEMWEKVVSNLLSNALKHTFSGEIAVELRHRAYHAELVVRDTGVGIPEDQLPHIFERFHRVRDARARSHEGSGIGLSLVQELVRQHYGRIRVRSKPGHGTTFTVWIPVGAPDRPRPAAEAGDEPDQDATRAPTASALATVASSWDTGEAAETPGTDILGTPAGEDPDGALHSRAAGARVIVADDNADMRAYLARLLGDHWQVSTAKDGEEALGLIRRLEPDLVLADVMMPRLDGLALLRAVRADERLRHTPVILVTAQAGQDAAVEGLLAGADDYIAKPFSARELVARVDGQLKLARARREGHDRFRALISASWDVVYRMSPDWTQMRALDGRGFIADTSRPSASWLDEYIHPDDQADVLDAIQTAIRDTATFALEHRVRRPDGTLAWTFSRAVPLLDDQGEIIEWVGAAADVTDRKRAEQQLAAEAERMAEVLARQTAALSLYHQDGTVRGWRGVNTDLTDPPEPS